MATLIVVKGFLPIQTIRADRVRIGALNHNLVGQFIIFLVYTEAQCSVLHSEDCRHR